VGMVFGNNLLWPISRCCLNFQPDTLMRNTWSLDGGSRSAGRCLILVQLVRFNKKMLAHGRSVASGRMEERQY
jgi:hypothetical protein